MNVFTDLSLPLHSVANVLLNLCHSVGHHGTMAGVEQRGFQVFQF